MAIEFKDMILADLRELKDKTNEAFRGVQNITSDGQAYLEGYTDGINSAIKYLAALDQIYLTVDIKVKNTAEKS